MLAEFLVSLIIYVLAVYGLTILVVEVVDIFRCKNQSIPKLSVILKVLNQEEVIEGIIRKIYKLKWQVGDFDLIVMDGGSFDSTLSILQRLQGQYGFQIISTLQQETRQKEILVELLKEPLSPMVCYLDLEKELELINRPEKLRKVLKGIA